MLRGVDGVQLPAPDPVQRCDVVRPRPRRVSLMVEHARAWEAGRLAGDSLAPHAGGREGFVGHLIS